MLAAYFLALGLTALFAWPHTYGAQESSRGRWRLLGGLIILMPLLIPGRLGIYLGLAGNSTVFFWASDTHMDPYWRTKARRARGLVGGVVVALLPGFLAWPLKTWAATLLVPTLGHLLLSGLATLFVQRGTERRPQLAQVAAIYRCPACGTKNRVRLTDSDKEARCGSCKRALEVSKRTHIEDEFA